MGVENVNLVKGYLPTDSRFTGIITDFQEYKERSKTVSTYTNPLLTDRRKGIVLRSGRIGLAFPNWYPVPAYSERGGKSDDKSGGQIQGRFSCKKPARQTEPASIRECSCSRFQGGKLVEYDVSQDHLRMAALLSGDPLLMEAYQKEGENIHTRTALTIFPEADPTDPGWKKSNMYKLGKTLNFLVLFRGGAAAFQSTALEDAEVEVDLSFCQDSIDKWYSKHHVYKRWQDEMIAQAARQGYLVLPTGWSRTFGIGEENIAGQAAEVCNFLHQAPCAQITESAQYKVMLQLLKYHLRSLVCLNIYDALFMDIYPGEEKNIDEIVADAMTNPPLLRVFEEWVGRTIPWRFEKKIYKSAEAKQ
jgi:DNA polymerase I-like protein with 3'-5' exonuclease and polymerase domains